MKKILLFGIMLLAMASCGKKQIVLLGDSTMAGKWIAPIIREETGMDVTNLAIVGQTAKQLEERLDRHLIEPKNSIVVVLIGINDIINGSKTEDIYDDILVSFYKLDFNNNRVYIIPPLPCDSYRYINIEKAIRLREVQGKIMSGGMDKEKYRVITVDIVSACSTLPREMDAGDHLHLNAWGQEVLAMAISQKIVDDYKKGWRR